MIKLVSCNQITFDFSWVATWWRSNYVCKSNIDCNLTLDNFPTPRTIVLGLLNNPPRCKQRPHLKKKKKPREILFPCGFRFMLFLIKSIWWALITCLSEILGCFKHCSLKGSITFKGTASQQRVLLHFYFTFSPVSGDSGVACELTSRSNGESMGDDRQRGLQLSKMWAAIFQGQAPVTCLLSFNCPWMLWSQGSVMGFDISQGSPETHIQAKMCQTTT